MRTSKLLIAALSALLILSLALSCAPSAIRTGTSDIKLQVSYTGAEEGTTYTYQVRAAYPEKDFVNLEKLGIKGAFDWTAVNADENITLSGLSDGPWYIGVRCLEGDTTVASLEVTALVAENAVIAATSDGKVTDGVLVIEIPAADSGE